MTSINKILLLFYLWINPTVWWYCFLMLVLIIFWDYYIWNSTYLIQIWQGMPWEDEKDLIHWLLLPPLPQGGPEPSGHTSLWERAFNWTIQGHYIIQEGPCLWGWTFQYLHDLMTQSMVNTEYALLKTAMKCLFIQLCQTFHLEKFSFSWL